MDSPELPGDEVDSRPSAPAPAREFGPWERGLLWLISSAVATAALALVAVELQARRFAPVILMPLMTGLALAVSLEGLARVSGVRLPSRALRLALVALWALSFVVGQDYIDYRLYYCRQYEQKLQSSAILELARGSDERLGPPGFLRWFVQTNLQQTPLWWTCDTLITVAAAVAWTALRDRRRSLP
jgi:hypothetical protein